MMSMIWTVWSYTSRRYVRVVSLMHSWGSRCMLLTTSRIGHTARRNSSSSRLRCGSPGSRRRGLLEHQLLELLEPVAVVLEDREAVVDDGVDQRVDEEARVVRPQPRARRLIGCRIGSQMSPGLSWKVRTVRCPRKMLICSLLGACLQLQHADDDEEPRLVPPSSRVRLDLRPLRDVEHVLDRERVEAVLVGERPDDARSVRPSTLIQRTPAHSGRWPSTNAVRSRPPRPAPARDRSRCT